MRGNVRAAAMMLSALMLVAVMGWAQAGKKAPAKAGQSFTGVIGDTMCGAKHMMAGGSDADCGRACVGKGADYALVVGDTLYTLKGDKAELNKYMGQKVTVSGKLSGKTIEASSVAAAGKS